MKVTARRGSDLVWSGPLWRERLHPDSEPPVERASTFRLLGRFFSVLEEFLMPRWQPPAFWFCQDCLKKCYRDLTTAESFASLSTYHGAPKLRVYECPTGRGFHLTKQDYKPWRADR